MGHGHLIVECEVRLVGSRWKRLDGFCHQSDVRIGLTKDDGLINNTFAIFLKPLILRARRARKIKGFRKMAKILIKRMILNASC
jgi:hypothetical protein